MYLDTLVKSECCGCTACESICPKKCIHMKPDKMGFCYPEIDKDKCISCGLCRKVCIFSAEHRKAPEPDCYYGWHNNEKVRMASTSGAAFVAIVEVAQKQGVTSFYGAAYDENLDVHHVRISNISEIDKLTTSKYVQSNMEDIFCDVRKRVDKGEKILFSGTPCQVEGLRSFLGEKRCANVLTVGLICHGVASPVCYRTYLDGVEKKENCKVKSIRFRDKRLLNGELNHRFTTIQLNDRRELTDTSNPYTVVFGLGYMQRESCYVCPYTTPNRSFDLSIGDFWGIERKFPELETKISNGISLVFAHTPKGKLLVNEMENMMTLHQVPVETAVNSKQQQLIKPIERPNDKESFLDAVLLDKSSFEKNANRVIKKYRRKRFKMRVKLKIKKFYT